ncbi:unnamed protein product [Notodromas monacha]|uniref:Ig-like domain-containing protein n=1 Tax=Notodromas monacha TaxID=399045 RepID=A0A7R9BZE6_9CRUS|nr:unnamed protein product [Notodromas monacha]CAG0923386.1 unnamed protein product [Notodromas monacha]
MLWLVPFLTVLALVLAQRTPTISNISDEKVVDLGDTTELTCSVQYAFDYTVLWVKIDPDQPGGAIPLSKGTSLILPETRFALRHNTASSTYVLQMKDIQDTDAGIYQCQVLISTQNIISRNVKVSVRQPPVISDDSTRSVVATVGEDVTLECYASGFPNPRVSWRRKNNAILPTGGAVYRGNKLRIPSVSKDDRGTYYCVAENAVGEGARRNVALDVEFRPSISIPRPRVGQADGYGMDLECHVEAYPQPAITWLKDGFQLANNVHYKLSQFSAGDDFTSATLRVVSAGQGRYGEYKCQAANKFGRAEGVVNLHETYEPVCPPACSAESGPKAFAAVILLCLIYGRINW